MYPEVIREISLIRRVPHVCTSLVFVPSSQPSIVSFPLIVTDLSFSYTSQVDSDTECKDTYLPKPPTK